MPWFDRPKPDFPQKWRDMSPDYQLFFVWMGAQMLSIMLGLGWKTYAALALPLLAVLVGLAIHGRRRDNWRWPRGRAQFRVFGVVMAAAVAAGLLWAYFDTFGYALPEKPGTFVFVASMIAFGLLSTTGLVQWTDAEYDAACKRAGEPEEAEPEPAFTPATRSDRAEFDVHRSAPKNALASQKKCEAEPHVDPKWKRALRGAWYLLFVLSWLSFLTSFAYPSVIASTGSKLPTATQTVPLDRNVEKVGRIRVYVTPLEDAIGQALRFGGAIGIGTLIISGFILHFMFGVYMFTNWPRTRGIFDE